MTNLQKRLVRLSEIAARDVNRFKPNPLGAGYLTRSERYNELRWEIERRIAKQPNDA